MQGESANRAAKAVAGGGRAGARGDGAAGDATSSAVPEGEIVIRGPEYSSHLRLSVSGDAIVVKGQVADDPVGCTIVEGHRLTVCPIAGAGGMEIVMAPPTTRSRSKTGCRCR